MTNHVFLTGVDGPLIPSPAFGDKGASPVFASPTRGGGERREPEGWNAPPPRRGIHPSVPCGDSSPVRGADALPERRRTLFHTIAAIVENFPARGKLGLDKRGVYRVYSYVARLFPANGEGACG